MQGGMRPRGKVMTVGSEEHVVRSLLTSMGVTINGDQPYDIQVHDARVYRRVLAEGAAL